MVNYLVNQLDTSFTTPILTTEVAICRALRLADIKPVDDMADKLFDNLYADGASIADNLPGDYTVNEIRSAGMLAFKGYVLALIE